MTPNTSSISPFPQPHLPGTPYYGPKNHDRTEGKKAGDPAQGELFVKLREWFDEGRDRSYKWRQEAENNFDMVAGWQWDLDDMAILNEDGRPSVVFNRLGRNIDLISGQEIQNREEVTFLPREQGDVSKSEVLSGGVDFIQEETDALDEKTDAFRDLTICGLGWTQTLMNYRDYHDGMPVESRVDPLEMYWDPHAHQRNLKNSRWRARAVTLPTREGQRKFPHVDPAMLSAHWANIRDDPSNPSDPDRQSYNYDDSPTIGRPPLLQRVTLIEFEWWEVEDFAIIEDLFTGERQELKKNRADALLSNIPGRFRGLPVERKVFYKAFLGGILLACRKMEELDDFTFQPMTGKRDRRVGWYGLVRAMSDPQKWANKWLSQSMHIMNSNGKGGVMFEEGAFADPVKAERDWGKPGAFTKLVSGTLAEGRIQERSSPGFDDKLSELMPLALSSIQDCVGVPDEMLGQATDTNPHRSAILEHGRREAGLVLMAHLFDSKRLFMKRQGRILLSYMLNFMNDGRLIRIVEEGQEQYVPMVFEDPDVAKYDIIVDTAPDAPNQREKTWGIIERFLPFVERLGAPPKFYADLLPYIPHFPSTLTRSLQQTLIEQQEQQQSGEGEADPAKMADIQLKAQKLPAEIEKLQAEAQRLEAQRRELESQIVVNFASAREKMANIELGSMEQIRETIALDDARELGKLSAHEAA